jgi:hypothetical protein
MNNAISCYKKNAANYHPPIFADEGGVSLLAKLEPLRHFLTHAFAVLLFLAFLWLGS